ncbi:MAG: glycosyltransferase family 4 protein [Chloroflexi bacterium]|nr:MAG: hypothetical protein CUN54_08610 [Phototrophicales bacterium]RMF77580.1 MAG: glycosyltransferase family 4 protein [Chloroflexota bacterium]
MHILLVPSWYATPTNPIRGSFFRDQARALQKAGHRVGMLIPPTKLRSWHGLAEVRRYWRRSNDDIDIADDEGIIIYRIPWWGWLPSLWPVKRGELALKIFDRYCDEVGQPDVLHAHSILYGGYIAAYIGQRRNIPVVLTEHSTNFLTNSILPDQKRIIRSTLRDVAKAFAVGPALAEAVQSFTSAHDVGVIWNIVDTEFFVPAAQITPADTFSLLMIASLTPRKGHDMLLAAFRHAFHKQNVTLTIVGSGYHGKRLEQLQARIADLELQNQIELLGLVSRDDLLSLIQQCHALVSSSYSEGFGVTLIEAMACGKPVIATRSGGPEHFVDEATGILVPVGDVDAMADAMRRMRDTYQHYAPDKIRAACIERFSEQAIVEQLVSVYKQLLEE